MKDVIKKEIIQWLNVGIIYHILDSVLVSHIQCVPKKGGMTIIQIGKNELSPTKIVIGWRICLDSRKTNNPTWEIIFLFHLLTNCWIGWLVKKSIAFFVVIQITTKLP